MTRNDPPRVIWLQVLCEDRKWVTEEDLEMDVNEVSWCENQLFDTDVRYVIDKRYLKKKRPK